jgi:hypothetical protein
MVRERQGLPITRNFADLDSTAVHEKERTTWIARQVHDITSAHLAQLDPLCHAGNRIRT